MFEASHGTSSIRLEATHLEPDAELLDHMFRLTYGEASDLFPYSRPLFRDTCFPVCSPEFLKAHPDALNPEHMADLAWIDIDWGPSFTTVPKLSTWLNAQGLPAPRNKPVAVHSVSSTALESAANGQGITLAQSSFASVDLKLGRLVQMSPEIVLMPEPYFVCWGPQTLENETAKNFLNWVQSVASQ
jgi:LysR family glycine cleavage system transcriptional activator